MEKAIELLNVSKRFRNRELYRNVNITIEKGKCVGFVGANGVGKSVLFQVMAGLAPVSGGKVVVNGHVLHEEGCDFPDQVGILINEPGYIEYLSGFRNLQLLAQIQNRIDDRKIRETMTAVGLDFNDKTPVRKYSMGMKQKLGIAQAIMEDQEIVILDEPYNALDFQTNREITGVLKNLKAQGKTLLLTSHQHEYLEKLCDELYCIENGEIVPFCDELRRKYFEIL